MKVEILQSLNWRNGSKNNGYLLIVITGFDLSRSIKSDHSSGLRLYEYADLVLDNYATIMMVS